MNVHKNRQGTILLVELLSIFLFPPAQIGLCEPLIQGWSVILTSSINVSISCISCRHYLKLNIPSQGWMWHISQDKVRLQFCTNSTPNTFCFVTFLKFILLKKLFWPQHAACGDLCSPIRDQDCDPCVESEVS